MAFCGIFYPCQSHIVAISLAHSWKNTVRLAARGRTRNNFLHVATGEAQKFSDSLIFSDKSQSVSFNYMLRSIKIQKKHLSPSMGGELELPVVAVIVFKSSAKELESINVSTTIKQIAPSLPSEHNGKSKK